MRKRTYIISALAVLGISFAIYAKLNTTTPTKVQLTRYHDSGQYYHDLSSVIKKATYYLQFRIVQNQRVSHHRKLAIVMDVDETALSNYNNLLKLDFSVDAKKMKMIERKANDPSIPFTLALFNYAKEHDVTIFFITSRDQTLKEATKLNLSHAGYQDWDVIYFKPSNYHKMSTQPYYASKRSEVTDHGYDIIMNIGNQNRSLTGGNSDTTFKLPNPFYHFS